MAKRRLIVTDDTGRQWVVLPEDPGYVWLDKLRKIGYDITRSPIPRETLMGNPPTATTIEPDLSIEELKEQLPNLVRRDLAANRD